MACPERTSPDVQRDKKVSFMPQALHGFTVDTVVCRRTYLTVGQLRRFRVDEFDHWRADELPRFATVVSERNAHLHRCILAEDGWLMRSAVRTDMPSSISARTSGLAEL